MSLRAVLIGGLLLIALGVVALLTLGNYPLLGGNRVGPAGFFTVVTPGGGQVCTGAPQHVPARTGQVVVRTSTSSPGPLDVTLVRGGRVVAQGRRTAPYASPKVKLNGKPVDALIRLEYRGADRVTWWSRIGAVARRFADGKASWVGSWTMWLALGLSLVAIVLGVVLLWRGPRRAALLCA